MHRKVKKGDKIGVSFDFIDLLRRVTMIPSVYALMFWPVRPMANATVMVACAGSML